MYGNVLLAWVVSFVLLLIEFTRVKLVGFRKPILKRSSRMGYAVIGFVLFFYLLFSPTPSLVKVGVLSLLK